MDFSKLKKSAGSDTIAKLIASGAAESATKRPGQDDRMWKPTADKMGNGYAVIRFLPADESDPLPWAKYWDHGFKGPTGQWLFEKSLTTLKQPCPISEANQVLWNSGNDDDKKIVRDRKRRLHYVSNILVLEDPSAPENEGKVFLHDFGKKIFDKIMDVLQPEFPDEKSMNPYDLWDGADFVMKIRKVEGYRSYEKSAFKSPSELFGGDETKLTAACDKIVAIGEFTDAATFKTYAEMQARLAVVLGEVAPRTTAAQVTLETKAPAPAPASKPEPTANVASAEPESSNEADPEDPLSYFQKYASGPESS